MRYNFEMTDINLIDDEDEYNPEWIKTQGKKFMVDVEITEEGGAQSDMGSIRISYNWRRDLDLFLDRVFSTTKEDARAEFSDCADYYGSF